jgi:H-type small acid-soluble spore protein
MNEQRIHEILDSHGVIDVRYQNLPVWIEQVNQDRAEVILLDTDQRLEVPLADLYEESSLETI